MPWQRPVLALRSNRPYCAASSAPSLELSEKHSLCWIDEDVATQQTMWDRDKRGSVAFPCSATKIASSGSEPVLYAICHMQCILLTHSDVCMNVAVTMHMRVMQVILSPTHGSVTPQYQYRPQLPPLDVKSVIMIIIMIIIGVIEGEGQINPNVESLTMKSEMAATALSCSRVLHALWVPNATPSRAAACRHAKLGVPQQSQSAWPDLGTASLASICMHRAHRCRPQPTPKCIMAARGMPAASI